MPLRENDPLQKIIFYLKKNTEKGYSIETLKIALLKQGYTRTEIAKAIQIFNNQNEAAMQEKKEKPKIRYELLDEQDNVVYQSEKKSFWRRLMFWR